MIDFKPITIEDMPLYKEYLWDGVERGCEYALANLFMWGEQKATILCDHMVIFSHFNDMYVYPYPIGTGDKRKVLDALMEDAKERGIPFRISGMCDEKKKGLETFYANQFAFFGGQDSDDYVYDINDLADLKGRKYHKKKNHYNRFKKTYPDYRIEPIGAGNIEHVKKMVALWYEEKMIESPDMDFAMEHRALDKALNYYNELALEGLALYVENELVAFTLASRISEITFDVHFEKALSKIDGAYAFINCEFAKYIREKYPMIQFLDREEDMGIEGLRKAKESYYPHHMIAKCYAVRKDEI